MTINKCVKWIGRYQRLILFLLITGMSGLAVATLHDLQTAQGAGLYLSLLYGQSDRRFFDLFVDGMGILLLMVALFLPCLLLKRLKLHSFFRFLCLYFAFVPVVYPGHLVHLPDVLMNLEIRQALLDGKIVQAMLEGVSETGYLLAVGIPILALLLAAGRETGRNSRVSVKTMILLEVVLFVIHFLFSGISQEALYFMYYLWVVWCFAEWENLSDYYPKLSVWGMILFGGCLLRGIYRMIEVMSMSHL